MTRRFFFAFVPIAAVAGGGRLSPRDELCGAGNEFHDSYRVWADKMNAAKKSPLLVPADAVEAFDPLPKLWRQVERKFRVWVQGR